MWLGRFCLSIMPGIPILLFPLFNLPFVMAQNLIIG